MTEEYSERLERISLSGYSIGEHGQLETSLTPDDINWLIELASKYGHTEAKECN